MRLDPLLLLQIQNNTATPLILEPGRDPLYLGRGSPGGLVSYGQLWLMASYGSCLRPGSSAIPDGYNSGLGEFTTRLFFFSGAGMVSENEELSPQQEDAEQVEAHGGLSQGSQGNVSRHRVQGKACERQHRPEREQGNQPLEKVGKSISCQGTHQNSREITAQQRIPAGERENTCSECGKHFTLNSTFVRHQRIHMGERPYKCCECGKQFSEKSNLITHQTKSNMLGLSGDRGRSPGGAGKMLGIPLPPELAWLPSQQTSPFHPLSWKIHLERRAALDDTL
uniref:C2H2-type domain-containing protein n=1 Tax=Gopherus agassizii TaxID=38772 RepID=A0A452H248_9SAUR